MDWSNRLYVFIFSNLKQINIIIKTEDFPTVTLIKLGLDWVHFYLWTHGEVCFVWTSQNVPDFPDKREKVPVATVPLIPLSLHSVRFCLHTRG